MTELSNIVYSDKVKVRFLFLVCCLLLLLLVIFGYFVYPVPYTDVNVYIPPAVSYASSGKLINPVFYLESEYGTSFVWLPPLFPMLIGILIPEATSLSAMRAITLFTSISFIMSNVGLFVAIRKHFKVLKSWIEVFVIVCAELLFVTILLATQQSGRPEPLSIMLMSVLVAGAVILSANRFMVLSGILIGLVASTHPVPGVIAISLAGFFLSLNNYNIKSIVYRLAVIGTLSIITFLFVLWISPNPVENIIRGILLHNASDGAIGVSGRNADLSAFLLSNNQHILFGFVLLVNFSFLLYFKRDSLQKINNKLALFIFVSVFAITLWYFVLRENRQHYFYPLVPIIFILIILLHIQILRRPVNRYLKAIHIFMIIPLILIPTTGLARAVGLFPFYLTELSLADARHKFQDWEDQLGDDYIIATEFVALLVDDHTQFRNGHVSEDGLPKARNGTVDLLPSSSAFIMNQKYSIYSSPPDRLGQFRLLADNFSYNSYKIFGVPLSNSTPAYGFAIYIIEDE